MFRGPHFILITMQGGTTPISKVQWKNSGRMLEIDFVNDEINDISKSKDMKLCLTHMSSRVHSKGIALGYNSFKDTQFTSLFPRVLRDKPIVFRTNQYQPLLRHQISRRLALPVTMTTLSKHPISGLGGIHTGPAFLLPVPAKDVLGE